MKLKVHPYLSSLLTKHFVQHALPKIVFPISSPFDVTQASFLKYWNNQLSMIHKKQALCFFMDEIVEMVNKTNSRLLYDDIISNIRNKSNKPISSDDDKYQLLDAFEMLWNVDDKITNEDGKELKGIKGHALTVKEEYLEINDDAKSCLLIQICDRIRNNSSFLESS